MHSLSKMVHQRNGLEWGEEPRSRDWLAAIIALNMARSFVLILIALSTGIDFVFFGKLTPSEDEGGILPAVATEVMADGLHKAWSSPGEKDEEGSQGVWKEADG